MDGVQRGNARRAAEVGTGPGNAVATFSESCACSCVWREHLGFLSSRKGQAKLKEKFLTEIRRQNGEQQQQVDGTYCKRSSRVVVCGERKE